MGALLCFLAVSPVISAGTEEVVKEPAAVISTAAPVRMPAVASVRVKTAAELFEAEAVGMYKEMNLKKWGLSIKAFEYALKGYRNLVEHGKVMKEEVLSICDFSQSSRRKRFYVIDMETKKVLINTWVAHGRNSGGEYARSFSNSAESHKSSLGFYVTRNTYYGDHGLALKIHGLESGINDKADERNIVIHGSEYVGGRYLRNNRVSGRSFGCPAVPAKDSEKVISTIKGGSCFFIYHPTTRYLSKSKLLND